jgi:hypothetical protein
MWHFDLQPSQYKKPFFVMVLDIIVAKNMKKFNGYKL